MKHHTNSIFGLGLRIVALVYLLGCKTHESRFSVLNIAIINIVFIYEIKTLLKMFFSIQNQIVLEKNLLIKNL